ncbi:MAG: hypothetical protein LBI99_06170 [Propionibacteriaceae bacterium]|jgi:hypothetical protein|nr:hypothetical protein [Propionibacteriaceae bacterium]
MSLMMSVVLASHLGFMMVERGRVLGDESCQGVLEWLAGQDFGKLRDSDLPARGELPLTAVVRDFRRD